MRKIAVRTIAIIFISLGVWYLVSFFLPLLVVSADKNFNLSYLVYTSFLFHAGFNLYKLKESGRNLTLILLLIRMLTNLAFSIWFLSIKGNSFNLWINFLDERYTIADSRIAFIGIMTTWSLVVLTMLIFLLQAKTKEIFFSEENLIASQAKTAP